MADLFLSYAREDQPCAELLADALVQRGWTVWWDRRIQVGRMFSEVIERQLDEARCVVALWSSSSIQSPWVHAEAAEAARKNRLVPVLIEDVRPPLEFRRLQTATWLDWQEGPDRPGFVSCLQSIEFLVSHTASQPLPDWPLPKAATPQVAPAAKASLLSTVVAGFARFCNTRKASTIIIGALLSAVFSFCLAWLIIDIWCA